KCSKWSEKTTLETTKPEVTLQRKRFPIPCPRVIDKEPPHLCVGGQMVVTPDLVHIETCLVEEERADRCFRANLIPRSVLHVNRERLVRGSNENGPSRFCHTDELPCILLPFFDIGFLQRAVPMSRPDVFDHPKRHYEVESIASKRH